MPITLNAYTGTQVANTTEWSLTANTPGPDNSTNTGFFQAFIDLNALEAGDVFEFRVYEKAANTSTQRLAYYASFANAQATPVWVSPPLILGNGWDMTIQKVSGTDCSIDWRISWVV